MTQPTSQFVVRAVSDPQDVTITVQMPDTPAVIEVGATMGAIELQTAELLKPESVEVTVLSGVEPVVVELSSSIDPSTVIDLITRMVALEARLNAATTVNSEVVQDIVAEMIRPGPGVNAIYDDESGTLEISAPGGGGGGVDPGVDPGGGGGVVTGTATIGVDTDGKYYYSVAGIAGGAGIAIDTDGVPYVTALGSPGIAVRNDTDGVPYFSAA